MNKEKVFEILDDPKYLIVNIDSVFAISSYQSNFHLNIQYKNKKYECKLSSLEFSKLQEILEKTKIWKGNITVKQKEELTKELKKVIENNNFN